MREENEIITSTDSNDICVSKASTEISDNLAHEENDNFLTWKRIKLSQYHI